MKKVKVHKCECGKLVSERTFNEHAGHRMKPYQPRGFESIKADLLILLKKL